MNRILSLIFFLGMLHSSSFAQTKGKTLEIYSITEYVDGYVIKAIDRSKSDTLNIISVKEIIRSRRNLERIIVGKRYNFEVEDLIHQMAALPPNNFVARIKTTVVWKPSDGMNNVPVYSRNTKGIWIKK